MLDHNTKLRRGGVYIAVLGTSLIVALLGLTALIGQRIQNRIVTASTDIRQAQLNANTAAQLGLLVMKQDVDWRTNRANGDWFTDRATGAGTCSLNVTDPLDGNLAGDPDEPVVVLGIGRSGRAVQRVRFTIDPRRQPLNCLRSAVAAGDVIDLQGDTLRTNGLITANQISAASSQVYGTVEALTVAGSTYNGATTQITSGRRPTMPNWATVFDYYRTNGTQILIGSLPTTPLPPPNNFARNPGVENAVVANDPNWTGTPPGMPADTAQVSRSNNWNHSGTYGLRVSNRTSWRAGAVQRIEDFVKPGQQYDVEAWASPDTNVLIGSGSRAFHMSLHVKGSNDASALVATSPSDSATWLTVVLTLISTPAHVTGRLTVPAWSGDLEYAFVKIADAASSGGTDEFYVDDLLLREVASGRYIYRKTLSPSVNTLYAGAPTNASEGKSHGIYWIDCGGQKLVIERSRILGTLLIVNPGAGSCVAAGPIQWSPAVPGYPAILVDADTATDADFSLQQTNRALSEKENGVNYNPAGVPHPDFGEDLDTNDIYHSEILGLVAIEDDLTYQNSPYVSGQILIGDDITNSSGTLEVDFNPESLLNPPPGFLAPHSHLRRPASAQKAVLP